MEGEGMRRIFLYANKYQRNHHLPFSILNPKPHTLPIYRTLWDQKYFSQPKTLTNLKHKPTLVPINPDFISSSSSSGAIHGHLGEGRGLFPWPTTLPPSHDTNRFINGVVFFNKEGTPNLSQEMNLNGGFGEEEDLASRIPKGTRRREKGGFSVALIKGLWTEEEDNTLRRLVKHFGVKKWAQLAEKTVGRTGKQCRERWHNHLRPNIKKDTWSPEEERLLVEAHMQVGNRWAEIAKRIPGRAANSIKNHWNTTKRRQNSRGKVKKPEGVQNERNQSTILQEYIKSTYSNNNSLTTISVDLSSTIVIPTNSATTCPTFPNSIISEDPSSTHFNLLYPELSQSTSDNSLFYLTQHSYDDEINFMQNLLGNNNLNASLVGENDKGKAPLDIGIDPKGDQENNQSAHIMDEGNALTAPPEIYPSDMNMKTVTMDQTSPSSRKEVDL